MNDPISSDVGVIAKALAAAGGSYPLAREIAETRKASPRVLRILDKAAISAGSLSDGDFGEILADWRISSAGFFTSLRSRSIFFRLLDFGFVRVPLRTRLGVVTASATGWIVGEGQPVPVSKLTLKGGSLDPVKAAALLVITSEVAQSMTDGAYTLVNTELRGAVSDTVDEKFFSEVIDGSSLSIVSSGNGIASVKADLLQLLNNVNDGDGGQMLWAMSPDVANGLALMPETFRNMSPQGGELLELPAYVSRTIPAGTLRLINGAAIAADADTIALDASRQADIKMADNPTNNSVTPTREELVSMFQTGSVAMKAIVSFGVERVRDNAVAELTGINWSVVEP